MLLLMILVEVLLQVAVEQQSIKKKAQLVIQLCIGELPSISNNKPESCAKLAKPCEDFLGLVIGFGIFQGLRQNTHVTVWPCLVSCWRHC